MDNLKISPQKPLIPPTFNNTIVAGDLPPFTNNPIIIGMPPPMPNDDDYNIIDDTVNQYSFIHPFTIQIQTSHVLVPKIFNQNQIIEGREVTLKGDSGERYLRYQMPPATGSGDMHSNIYIPMSYLTKNDTPKSTAAEKNNAMYVFFGFVAFVLILGTIVIKFK